MIYLIGFYIFFTICFSIYKKNNTFNSFKKGVIDGIQIVLNMFSILLTFSFCITCIQNCGLIEYILIKYNESGFVNILIQMIVRPLSSSSSYAIVMNIYDKYGIDSYYGYLSTLIHSSCDTLFYIITIYSSYSKVKLSKRIFILGFLLIIFNYFLVIIISSLLLK